MDKVINVGSGGGQWDLLGVTYGDRDWWKLTFALCETLEPSEWSR